jgi:uncharacterized membrane protein
MISNKTYSWILIIGGAIGILMSLLLTIDKLAIIKNPNVELPCNINPVVSCGPIINTPQASVFGFPNPLIGLLGFGAALSIGVLLAIGSLTLDKKVLNILLVGNTLAILFVHWLISQALFVIGALCVYCMATWAFTWPLFWYTLNQKYTIKNSLTYFVGWYLLIIFLILFRFRDFFFN